MSEEMVTAKLSRLRMSPRKVRLVADLIRNKPVDEARQILKFTVKAPSQPIAKLMESAVANARHNFKMETDNLVVRQITVDEGPIFKRFRPESRGRVGPIQKKTSHITLVLSAGKPEEKKSDQLEKKPKSKVKSAASKKDKVAPKQHVT